jgi:hypothetical protein
MKNIHVLPTDKPSRFFITNEDEYGFREHYVPDTMQTIKCMNIHITSNEEIKEGVEQWYLDKFLNKPMNSGSAQYGEKQNVIILTTDQDLIKDGVQPIDDDFLEWFVNNPSCESVEVDRDEREVGNHLGGVVIEYGDYKIITPQEEPKDVVLGYKTSIVAQMLDSKEELKQEMSKRVKINFEIINKGRYVIIPPEKVAESREQIKQNMKTFLKKIKNKK